MKIGIIGAGAAGLTAAYELGKKGHEVVVFERAPFVGGQASTFDLNGSKLERGYHHLFLSDVDIIDLVKELDMGEILQYSDSSVGTFYDKKIYKFGSSWDLLKFSPISIVNRIRLGLVTLFISMIKDWKKIENFTADEWLRKYAGNSAYDAFWGPMLKGKFGEQYFNQIGMTWIWGKIHTRFASRSNKFSKEKLIYPIGGFEQIFEKLTTLIRKQGNSVNISQNVSKIIIQNQKVIGLEVHDSPASWSSPQPLVNKSDDQIYSHSNSNIKFTKYKFDSVIATCSTPVFSQLIEAQIDVKRSYLTKLKNVEYMSAVMLILVINKPFSKYYWLNIADSSIPFVGIIEHTNLVSSSLYGGKHILYITNYLTKENRLYKLEHKDLLSEYIPHLLKINPEFDGSFIEDSYIHKVDYAQPIVGSNYSKIILEHNTPIKGLYLCNTTQVYPEDRGTNYSVQLGKKIAAKVMEKQ
ncbi:MAG: NAD(P)/FAD-dependent oxidoreductase [SAR202 cluster bacterium]|nr:NAD(P)/FAD-dependent oxidoreductase [SAR202 cluster bacterium]|tara:strand:+ start:11527 stop:12927 length:1401 start_codon:yes stop_codon:yes gene_type:complete